MKLGLVGAGRIGTNHARILSTMPEITELVVFDPAPGRADALADELDFVTATSGDAADLFGDVDAAIIASSSDTHIEMLHGVADAHIPAFCEKPIAIDLEETRKAVEAVEESGIDVLMGFQRRYDPAMREIRNRIVSGDVGKPYLVRSQTHDPAPPPFDYIPTSGGIFRDCLIHDIDIVRFVTGQGVVSVRAAGAVLGFPEIGEMGDVDTATAILEMSEGTIAQISGLRHDPVGYDVRLEVFGSKDSVAAGWTDRSPIRSLEAGATPLTDPITTFWDRFDAAYRAEMAGFVAMVKGEEEPASTPRDAYQDLRVAAACDLSLAEGRTVFMQEIT